MNSRCFFSVPSIADPIRCRISRNLCPSIGLITSCVVFVFALFLCAAVHAGTAPTYESFDYAPGLDLGIQATNAPDTSVFQWTHIPGAAGPPDKILVGNGNLIYPGLKNSVGNCITNKAGVASQGLRYESGGVN